MNLFLSYARQDEEMGCEIAASLGQRGFDVYHWRDPRQRGGRFLERIEQEIGRADAFLALVSPHFLASGWCRLESDLAMYRELEHWPGDPARPLIHVLQIARTSYSDTGSLCRYDWIDLTGPQSRERGLAIVANRLGSSDEMPHDTPPMSPSGRPPVFRNRQRELDQVMDGLRNPGGQHFWLVISPPQLGKSWFLNRLSTTLEGPGTDDARAGDPGWATRLVDLAAQPLDARSDAALLLKDLFGLASQPEISEGTLMEIAQTVLGSGQPYLCLLDSAERLEQETARTLRKCLSRIYQLVQDGGSVRIRLGFVVASRQEDAWRGVTPAPRLHDVTLTEFKVDVVRQALVEAAQEADRQFSPANLAAYAALAHHLSEGLPALLVRCFQWIQQQQWLGLGRLGTPELFDELAAPYIRERLLSMESLLPSGGEHLGWRREALRQTFRVLAPYRLFTQSHLRHHLDRDSALAEALSHLRWTVNDLWQAISATALLLRPLDEPWQEIHSAIRRLLYRYYYASVGDRIAAHRDARSFVEAWGGELLGKEQVVGLVECLWHEAHLLHLQQPDAMAQQLTDRAGRLCRALRSSNAYAAAELRGYTAKRIGGDEELREVVEGVDSRLFEALIEAIRSPHEGTTDD